MTIDVEDYFHVSAFDGVVPRSRWETLESRVCANTERVLDILDERRRAGDVLRARVGGRAASGRSCARIAARGHEIASHGYAHRLVYDQTAGGVPGGRAAGEARCSRTWRACACDGFRAPSYSITPRSLWALDILIEEGYRYDASIFPDPPRSLRHPGLRAATCIASSARRAALIEVPASDAAACGDEPAGRRRRLLPASCPYAWTRWGIAPHQPTSKAGRPCSTCTRGRSIPSSRGCRSARLSRFRHYTNLRRTEERLRRLLDDFAFGPMAKVMLPEADATGRRRMHSAFPFLTSGDPVTVTPAWARRAIMEPVWTALTGASLLPAWARARAARSTCRCRSFAIGRSSGFARSAPRRAATRRSTAAALPRRAWAPSCAAWTTCGNCRS